MKAVALALLLVGCAAGDDFVTDPSPSTGVKEMCSTWVYRADGETADLYASHSYPEFSADQILARVYVLGVLGSATWREKPAFPAYSEVLPLRVTNGSALVMCGTVFPDDTVEGYTSAWFVVR